MNNPTLLTLLKAGCRVEFPSGYLLTGDPKNGYINTGFNLGDGYQSDGLRCLDPDGIKEAIKDERYFFNHNK